MSATIHKSLFQHLYCHTHNCHNQINWSIGQADGPESLKNNYCTDCIKSMLASAPAEWIGDDASYQAGYKAGEESNLIELNNLQAQYVQLIEELDHLKDLNQNLHDVIANFEAPDEEELDDTEDADDSNEEYADEEEPDALVEKYEELMNESPEIPAAEPDPTATLEIMRCLDCGYEVPEDKVKSGNGKRALTAHRMSCKAKV